MDGQINQSGVRSIRARPNRSAAGASAAQMRRAFWARKEADRLAGERWIAAQPG